MNKKFSLQFVKRFINAFTQSCKKLGSSGLRSQIGQELFRFTSYSDWVSDSKFIYKGLGMAISQVVMFDNRFRKCETELDFKRALADNAYPIIAYRTANNKLSCMC